jgi:hypothetical protein
VQVATNSWVLRRAVLLQNGEVLVVGGGDGHHATFASAELYTPG